MTYFPKLTFFLLKIKHCHSKIIFRSQGHNKCMISSFLSGEKTMIDSIFLREVFQKKFDNVPIDKMFEYGLPELNRIA